MPLIINKNKILLQIGRTSIEACLLDKKDIQKINLIKTRKDYENEIEIEKIDKEFKEKKKPEENKKKDEEKAKKAEEQKENGKEEKPKNIDPFIENYFDYAGKKY